MAESAATLERPRAIALSLATDLASAKGRPAPNARARAFAAARRHSSLVRVLRVSLLGGALGVVAVLIAVAVFDPFGKKPAGLSIGAVGVDGTRVTMQRPRLSGYRNDGRAYLVNADKAIQDVSKPTLVELRGIDAELAMADNKSVRLTAESGFYDNTKEHMDVSNNVRIKSEQYDVRLSSASIDFKTGRYASSDPVTIVTRNGTTIAADSVTASDNGKVLAFAGHVRSSIQPAAATADTTASIKGAQQ